MQNLLGGARLSPFHLKALPYIFALIRRGAQLGQRGTHAPYGP